ncbi:MAG: hypothetical protein KME20_01020 [Kaiparowitsia implicata GSE-PSE-MK54-09C]|jgi:hypothetical protein|nr:hypothetical protein [Kaiparowitsia implicata GSE-PSE-MK54-09C]
MANPAKVAMLYAVQGMGDRCHPTQTVKKGHHRGEPYVDFSVNLPRRSLQEFGRWVNRYMHLAKILTPDTLAKNHRQNALTLASRYKD